MDPEQQTSTPPKEQESKAAEKKATVIPSQSPATTTTTNVYVRRKVETDTSKDTLTKLPKVSSSSAVPPPDWEEHYHHLQMNLNKLNESDQTDPQHLQMLWSQSSAELSKHAVDLEKRSIQLSLEEAREMQRVAALNVLGKSANDGGLG